jgi:hypothetical protein
MFVASVRYANKVVLSMLHYAAYGLRNAAGILCAQDRFAHQLALVSAREIWREGDHAGCLFDLKVDPKIGDFAGIKDNV